MYVTVDSDLWAARQPGVGMDTTARSAGQAGRSLGAVPLAHLALLGTMLLHGLDHVRQGLATLPLQVRVGGAVLAFAAAAVLPFTLRNRPRAPRFAAFLGLLVAAAVINGHLTPWGAYSYPEVGVDAVSWIAMLSEVAAALVLAGVAVGRLRRHGAGTRVVS